MVDRVVVVEGPRGLLTIHSFIITCDFFFFRIRSRSLSRLCGFIFVKLIGHCKSDPFRRH